jgi:hypothetical protein
VGKYSHTNPVISSLILLSLEYAWMSISSSHYFCWWMPCFLLDAPEGLILIFTVMAGLFGNLGLTKNRPHVTNPSTAVALPWNTRGYAKPCCYHSNFGRTSCIREARATGTCQSTTLDFSGKKLERVSQASNKCWAKKSRKVISMTCDSTRQILLFLC